MITNKERRATTAKNPLMSLAVTAMVMSVLLLALAPAQATVASSPLGQEVQAAVVQPCATRPIIMAGFGQSGSPQAIEPAWSRYGLIMKIIWKAFREGCRYWPRVRHWE